MMNVELVAISGIVFFSTFVVLGMVRLFALKTNVVSNRDYRRRQTQPVALLGGLGIFLVLTAYGSLLSSEVARLCLCALPVAFVGAYDDIREQHARYRLFAQIATAVLFVVLDPMRTGLFPLQTPMDILWSAFCVFWIVGVLNGFNMIDGLDAYLSTYVIGVFVSLAILSNYNVTFAMIPIACVAGFLVWNRPPAKMYLGDAGSNLLGIFALAGALKLVPATVAGSSGILVAMLLLSLPEMDAVMAIYRRIRAGSKITEGDFNHLHHRLRRIGLSLPQIYLVVLLICATSAIGAAAMLKAVNQPLIFWGALALTVLAECGILFALKAAEKNRASATVGAHDNWFYETLSRSLQPPKDPRHVEYGHFIRSIQYDLKQYILRFRTQSDHEPFKKFIDEFAAFIEKSHPNSIQRQLDADMQLHVWEPEYFDLKPVKQLHKEFFEILDRHDSRLNSGGSPVGVRVQNSPKRKIKRAA